MAVAVMQLINRTQDLRKALRTHKPIGGRARERHLDRERERGKVRASERTLHSSNYSLNYKSS